MMRVRSEDRVTLGLSAHQAVNRRMKLVTTATNESGQLGEQAVAT